MSDDERAIRAVVARWMEASATGDTKTVLGLMTDDATAIRQVVETWMAASRKGDLETVLGLMTDDVVFMVPGKEPFGKEAFAKTSDAQRNVRMDGRSDIRELEVLPGREWAYVRNYITVTATPPDGRPIRREGWTLTILRKGEDGEWRVARDANLMAAHA